MAHPYSNCPKSSTAGDWKECVSILESWKSGVLPVLGERTIQREKTANPLELDVIWMSSGIQRGTEG